jgi:hypothetical protein
MNKVILLVLLMPVTAFGQIMENFESGNLSGRAQSREGQWYTESSNALSEAGPGDIIISEIMADPLPVVSLPGKEYIEIHNRTGFTFNTKGWSLSDGKTSCTFPERIILPGAFMILCQLQDTALFNSYGKTTGLKSFPALTDGGKILFIRDKASKLIHGIEYSSDWYGDALKNDGGWSLEIIDTDYPFYQEGNWHASVSKEGGTPGRLNSVSNENPDNIFSGIENVFPVDSKNISIKFSETIIDLDKNIKYIEIKDSEISSLFPADPLMREYTAILWEPLQNGRIYILTAGNEITDFAGNRMQRNTFRFGIPEPVQKGDILFNELLFNPFSGEPDFIEFYNTSKRIIDASDLILVSVNDKLKDTSSVVFVSAEKRCILPGDYYAATTDKKSLLERFSSSDPDMVFEVPYLPSMPDDNGHLILYDRKLMKIDEVFYDEDMHYSLLSRNEGISLEKIRTNGLSADRSQWHSASGVSGWGTPGVPNSVLSEEPENSDKVVFSSTRITPDNDGNEDFLVIDFTLTGTGNVISITVFDETGSFVKKLTDNQLAGPAASIVWNATAKDEKLVSTGIYIILISVFDDSGKIHKWKKVCTVIR